MLLPDPIGECEHTYSLSFVERAPRFLVGLTHDDRDTRHRVLLAPVENSGDDLAFEACGVELSLPRDREVGVGERGVEADRLGDHIETGSESRAEGDETAGQATGGTTAFDPGDIHSGARLVLLRDEIEPAGEQCDLRVAGTLLRSVQARGVSESRRDVARDGDVDTLQGPAQRLDRTESAIGRRTAAHRDDHLTESFTTRGRDQLTGSACRRAQRIVARTDERKATRTRHLDDRDGAGQHRPLRVDRITERPGDTGCAQRATASREHRVDGAFAAVCERNLHHIVEPRTLETGGDRGRGVGGRQRSTKLVGTRDRAGHVQ